jgi:hypothetical protein
MIYDIYLDKNFIAAKYVGRSPPDQNQPGESKSARIKSYACDGGSFTMTEVESSDNMDCKRKSLALIIVPSVAVALLLESSTSNFKLDDRDRIASSKSSGTPCLLNGKNAQLLNY